MCSKPKMPSPPPPPPPPEKPKPFKHAKEEADTDEGGLKKKKRVGTSALTIPLTGTGVNT
jgi:hypothetical protein